MAKPTVGLVEEVKLQGKKSLKTWALLDTGAKLTSVDIRLASEAGLGPVTRIAKVKNPSHPRKISRPVVPAKISLGGKMFDVEVNLQDRSHMNFEIIIGRNILAGNFQVDAELNGHLFDKKNRSKA